VHNACRDDEHRGHGDHTRAGQAAEQLTARGNAQQAGQGERGREGEHRWHTPGGQGNQAAEDQQAGNKHG